MRGLLVLLLIVDMGVGCKKTDHQDPSAAAGDTKRPPGSEKKIEITAVAPPADLKNPPADATKTASGLAYKKLTTVATGDAPKRNDTVMVHLVSWRPSTGETVYSTREMRDPVPLNLINAAPGFVEGMQLIKKGEKAVLWVPPQIGYQAGKTPASPEAMVYEIEVVDIKPAPPIPADLAGPPADALQTKSGVKYVVVRPGTGTEKAKLYDNATFNYTGWEPDGKMFDSTEMKKTPAHSQPYRQPAPFRDVLLEMTAGERVRFWTASEKMQDTKDVPEMPKGQLVYEVELLQLAPGLAPPVTPPDVAKPPADAKKTGRGVFYKFLKKGPGGPHPKGFDKVKVHYSGWTTDGKMFDSSVAKGQPYETTLVAVIPGWTDGLQVMSVGDKARFWIPEELAYKGAPGQPKGMLVFDIEMLGITPGRQATDLP
jgi:FKBP-type peptidyl-prolyl cis-trans isomerase